MDVRRLALDAFPEVQGFDRPKNIQGPKTGLPRVRPITNTRSNFYRGWSWSRIPDLPQVKAAIAFTNRVVSRAEAERNPTGSKVPTAPAKPRPVRPENPEVTRRIAELRAAPSPQTARDLLTYVAEPGPNRFPGPDVPHSSTTRPRSHALIAPRGSIIDELNRYGGAPEMPCGERPVTDRGPLDPRLVDTFAIAAPHDVLAGQEAAPPAEPGAAALREGDLVGAASELIEHLDASPEDARATRRLALVILLRDAPESAEKSMLEAYRLDPALAAEPLSRDDLPARADPRQLMLEAVTRANKTATPQSWLVVSVLMQAQGRGDTAARMMARARGAGLDPAIADAFDAELARD
ncbi:MAG: hypothetical protein IT437_12745 [Phycisphaerales bacterium]|nr:hypothetical protein [Phycisphaerales bacterium]